jgi:hypothetical protein
MTLVKRERATRAKGEELPAIREAAFVPEPDPEPEPEVPVAVVEPVPVWVPPDVDMVVSYVLLGGTETTS